MAERLFGPSGISTSAVGRLPALFIIVAQHLMSVSNDWPGNCIWNLLGRAIGLERSQERRSLDTDRHTTALPVARPTKNQFIYDESNNNDGPD
jgi:hypothetical protein